MMPENLLFGTYQEAFDACDKGYENNDLVEMVFAKTLNYSRSIKTGLSQGIDLSSLKHLVGLLKSIKNNQLKVIDFGGACGANYFLLKAFLGDNISLQWHVVETPAMVEKSRSLEDGCLKFFINIDDAVKDLEDLDLVFASGSLPYCPNPYETLEKLVACGAKNLFITQTALHSGDKDIVTIQKSRIIANGPGPAPRGLKDGYIEYPLTFCSKAKIENILKTNYEIDVTLVENESGKQAFIRTHPFLESSQYPASAFGYLCTTK